MDAPNARVRPHATGEIWRPITASGADVTAQQRIDRVPAALQRRFRAAGHGSITRVEEALSLGTGYFKDQRRPSRRRVDIKVLFRALEVLEVDPADFFADALGPADAVDGFRSEAAALRRKIKPKPKILTLIENLTPADGGTAADGETIALAPLDALTTESPKLVVRRCHLVVRQLQSPQIPALLGICASAHHLSGRLDAAQVILAEGLDHAEDLEDPAAIAAAIGDLVQRASHIVAARGDLERALTLSERATLAYVEIGNLAGIGKTLVDQGIWLRDLGRLERAVSALTSALDDYFPAAGDGADVGQSRATGLLHLALAYHQLGEMRAAQQLAEQTRAADDDLYPLQRGQLIRLRAAIAGCSDQLDEAERLFRQAADVFMPISPLDTARTSVELIRVQLLEGRNAGAYATAKAMTRLLEPLKRDRAASEAIADLLRPALAGRGLTVELAGRVSRSLARGQASRHPRLAA